MIGPRWFVSLVGFVLITISLSCTTQDPPQELPLPERIPPSRVLTAPQIEKAAPVQEAAPQIQVVFDHLEAKTTEHITLYFVLQVDNPRSMPASIAIRGWQFMVNGLPQHEGTKLFFTEEEPRVDARTSAQFPLGLAVDLSRCSGLEEAELDICYAKLETDTVCTFTGEEHTASLVSAEVAFPRIREPKFTVTTIVVHQGELINTRLKVGLRIDNPNRFPLELSSLAYEFYGDDQFWADGTDPVIRSIPAQSSAQAQVLMVMNFIDMNRKLLEDILAAKQVYYRFTGEAAVLTTIEYLPRFSVGFDLSGNSVVVK
ncbi:MAG: LEA type 2 family protein [Treponema sp.]|jgi:LEA14-like dessication related protein|nr:LEA type 2 family protein [Treponema sp.]